MDADRPDTGETAVRRRVLATLARASRQELDEALARWPGATEAEILRGPESGLVMVRGRIGGDGNAFNLGEVTVTRATVRLPEGAVGFGYALGRDGAKVRAMATLDALWQLEESRALVEAAAAAIANRLNEEDAQVRDETAATKVDFFTMVRGED